MAADPFIDPILQNIRGVGVRALVGAATAILDTGAEFAEEGGKATMAWLSAITIGASLVNTAIQHYNNKKRSEEEAARERRREELQEQHNSRNEENLLRHGQEVRNLIEEQTNRQQLALVQSEQRQTQARERADFESVIYDLDDRVNLFRDYQRQFANDPPRLVEETKIFQRDIGFFLKKLSSSMLRGHVDLNALRVWVNAAAFHIQMNSHMTNAGIQSAESLCIAIANHRETARNLCSEYRRYNQVLSSVGEIREVEMYFHDVSNNIEYPINRSVNVNSSQIAGSSNQVGTDTQNNESLAIEMTAYPHRRVKLMLVSSAIVGILAIIFLALVPS